MRVTRTHVTDVSFADTTLTPGNARGLAASRTQQTCNVWAHPTLGGRYPGLIKIRQGSWPKRTMLHWGSSIHRLLNGEGQYVFLDRPHVQVPSEVAIVLYLIPNTPAPLVTTLATPT